ncbi:helicase-like protein [Trypanosoma cruzi]|nr:helicase-like protein [Trypanosoma cruzi]
MTLVPYTPSEWCDIGARLWDMVCQCGDTQVQMTFINGNQMEDETLTVAASSTGLCLLHGPISKAWQDSTLIGHIANLRAPQIPNFETQALMPAMGAVRELGHQQGLITAERERLNIDYANAVADVENRNAQLNSQVEEAHHNLSVRESTIAGAGNQVLELRQQLEADRAQLREREFNLGVLTGQFQEREARLNALQTARDAETAGRDESPATRHAVNDGVTTLPHQTNILMAGGVPSSAARHSSAAHGRPHGKAARPHFHPSTPSPSSTSPLDARLPMEEERGFCAFDVTTWPSRVWNEGASGVVIDLRCAYQCWQQDNEQVKLAFGNLVEWIGALEVLQDPPDRIMNLGRSLLNTFRMQLTIASDPGIRLSKLRARLYTVCSPDGRLCEGSPAFRRSARNPTHCAMPTMSYFWTRGIYMQCAPQKELLTIQAPVKKRPRGCRTPLMNAGDGSPIHFTTSHQSSQASHRAANAPSNVSNCPTKSSRRAMELIRQRRSTTVRRITDIPALGQLYEESKRVGSRDVCAVNVGAENVPSGAIHKFLPHARTADKRGELCGLFDGNRSRAIDPTAPRQDAAVHVGNGSNPAGHGDSRVTKNCGAIGKEASAPLDKGKDESICPQPDRLEGMCCFRLAWITASCWSDIAALTPNNFTLEPDGALILDWSVALKTARADPHRASRFVGMRGQDAFDTIKLCRTL